MSVAIDSTGVKLVGPSSVTTITYNSAGAQSFTPSAGATGLLVFASFGTTNTTSAWSCTWDSGGTNQAMTLLKSQATATTQKADAVIFGLINPTTGSNKTAVLSWTGSSIPTVCAISVTGSDTTSIVNAFKNAVAGANVASLAVTSAVGDMAVMMESAVGLTSVNQTTIWNDVTSSGADSAGSRAAGAATVTFTATGGSGSQSLVGVSIAAGSATPIVVGWLNDRDQPLYTKPSFSAAPAFISTFRTAGISGSAWNAQRDHVRLPPKVAISDPPALGSTPPTAASTIAGMAWYEPPDRDKPSVKISQDATPPGFGRFVPAVGISGIGWFEPSETRQPKASVTSDPPALGSRPIVQSFGWFTPLDVPQPKKFYLDTAPSYVTFLTPSVPISGMAWDTLHETDKLAKGSYLTDPVAVPYAPQIITWSFLVGDTIFIADAPRDNPPAAPIFSTPAATVPVSGMAWFTPLDWSKAKVSFDQPSAFALRPVAGTPISGIGWFEPPDVDKRAVKINGEAPPAQTLTPPSLLSLIQGMGWFNPLDQITVKPSFDRAPAHTLIQPAPPVGISGIAWFEPPPGTVKVTVGFSDAPALQQSIIQIAPPPSTGDGSTVLSDRKAGGGYYPRKKWEELLEQIRLEKAALEAPTKAKKAKEAVARASEAAAKLAQQLDQEEAEELARNVVAAERASKAVEAIRLANEILRDALIENEEEEELIMLLLTS